jgi:hypothetical protein
VAYDGSGWRRLASSTATDWTVFVSALRQDASTVTATQSGRYRRDLDSVFATAKWDVTGSGTSTTAIDVQLPVSCSTAWPDDAPIGVFWFADASATDETGLVYTDSADRTRGFLRDYTGATTFAALASGDDIFVRLAYEA